MSIIEVISRVFIWFTGIALAVVAFLELFPLETYRLFDFRYFLLYLFAVTSFFVLICEVKRLGLSRSSD
jgi:hypothetical protein